MRKTIKALALCAVLLVTSAFAQSNYDKKDGCPQVPSGPHAFCYPKDVGLACPQDFYLFGEFLLFQAEEEGLDFCIKNNLANGWALPLRGGNVEGFSSGPHEWNWNFGGRFGFGFYLNHDNWNIEAKWTYLHIKEDRTVSATNAQTLVPLFLPPTLVGGGQNQYASARWKAKLNIIDLDLGKPYFVSRYFIMHPFMGARALWIDQDYVARYSGIFNAEDGVKMISKNDRWGVGLRGGFKTEWMLGAGWLLYGDLAGSIMYGKYDISQELAAGGAYSFELDQDYYVVNPNLELRLGVLWTHHFCENKYRIALGGAYEFHYFWDENQLKRFYGDGDGGALANGAIAANDTVSRGDLSLNGLSFRLQFDF